MAPKLDPWRCPVKFCPDQAAVPGGLCAKHNDAWEAYISVHGCSKADYQKLSELYLEWRATLSVGDFDGHQK